MSGRKNVIDCHPQKEEIVKALLENVPYRHIAEQFGSDEYPLSPSALVRYAKNNLKKDVKAYCVKEQSRADNQEERFNTVDSCVKNLEWISCKCKSALQAAEADLAKAVVIADKQKVHSYTIGYIRELRSTIESIGKFIGGIKEGTSIVLYGKENTDLLNTVVSILNSELVDYPMLLMNILHKLQFLGVSDA